MLQDVAYLIELDIKEYNNNLCFKKIFKDKSFYKNFQPLRDPADVFLVL